MRLLELRFKNINSLIGEWKIDFTAPEYSYSNIFAISGPTGAGKSSILDAICLALYGKTPRIKTISATQNEVMSLNTMDCYAEICFESETGTYFCHWSQHRAKKTGALQQARHEISDARKQLLESKTGRTAILIVEKIGLTFEQFTKSVLLAQNKFSEFLFANYKSKAAILEQITGIEIYAEISASIYAKDEQLRRESETLKKEMEAMVFYNAEEEKEQESRLRAMRENIENTKKQLKAQSEHIILLKHVKAMADDLSQITDEKKRNEDELKEFAPMETLLQEALKIKEIENEYKRYKEYQLKLKKTQELLEDSSKQLPDIEQKKIKLIITSAEIIEELKEHKNKHALTKELHDRVRLKDQQITEKMKSCRDLSIENKKLHQDMNAHKLSSILKDRNMPKVESITPVISELFNNIGGQGRDKDEKDAQIKKLNSEIQLITESLKDIEVNYDSAASEHNKISTQLQKYEEERRDLLKGKSIKDYQEIYAHSVLLTERSKLASGSPCPLCGATEHAFLSEEIIAIGQVSVENLLFQAESLRTEIDEFRQYERTHSDNLNNIISEKDRNQTRKEQVETDMAKLKEVAEQISDEIEVKQKQINAMVVDYGLHWNDNILAQLNYFAEQEKEYLAVTSIIAEKTKKIDTHENEIKDLSSKRNDLYGIKDPKVEEDKLLKMIEEAEYRQKENAGQISMETMKESVLNTQIAERKQLIEDIKKQHDSCYNNFCEFISKNNIQDEEDYLQKSMHEDERAKLSATHTGLTEKAKNIDTRLLQKNKDIENANTKISSLGYDKNADTDELEAVLKIIEADNAEKSESVGELRKNIINSQDSKSKYLEKEEMNKKQDIEHVYWRRLNGLIGSAEGDKFRTFAQGLTFDIVLNYANKQLSTMTDSFTLIRDTGKNLGINIIDNRRAGTLRPVENLSGGESFLVSLALALGLSTMASKRVRIDSLFLDEGFGTLDVETMNVALDALCSLQHEGKLIGIISHMPALKDRLSTWIEVVPKNGESIISGPGVVRIS